MEEIPTRWLLRWHAVPSSESDIDAWFSLNRCIDAEEGSVDVSRVSNFILPQYMYYTHIEYDGPIQRRMDHYTLVGRLLAMRGEITCSELWPPLYLDCQTDLPWYHVLLGLSHNSILVGSLDYQVLCEVCLQNGMVPISLPPARKWSDKAYETWKKEIRELASIAKNVDLYYTIAALAGRPLDSIPTLVATMPSPLAERVIEQASNRDDLSYLRGEGPCPTWMREGDYSSLVPWLASIGLLHYYTEKVLSLEVTESSLFFCEYALTYIETNEL